MTSPSECQKKADRRAGLSDPCRESSDYNCNRTMKRTDSSSQAPQNDKEKRNGGGQPSKITIVSRETAFRSPCTLSLFQCAPESAVRPQDLSCACFSCTNTDRARLTPCSARPICNLQKHAKRVNRFSIQNSASFPFQRSVPIQKTKIPHFASSRRGFPILLIPKGLKLYSPNRSGYTGYFVFHVGVRSNVPGTGWYGRRIVQVPMPVTIMCSIFSLSISHWFWA